jgi:hypothetical protein
MCWYLLSFIEVDDDDFGLGMFPDGSGDIEEEA